MRLIALLEHRDRAAGDLLESARQHVRLLSRTPRKSILRRKELLQPSQQAQVSLEERESQEGTRSAKQSVEHSSNIECSSNGAHVSEYDPMLSGQPVDRRAAPAEIGPRPIIPETVAAFMRSLLR
jgi:hypothetical protein